MACGPIPLGRKSCYRPVRTPRRPPEADGQARVRRHFPADRGTWIMEFGPAAQRLDLEIVTWVP